MKKYLIFALLVLSCFAVTGQEGIILEEKTKTKATAHLNVFTGIPVGIFKEKQAEVSFGWGGNILFELREPISVGFDFTWQKYDEESDFFIDFDEFGNALDTEEETSHQILGLNGLLHLEPEVNFFLQPYFEGTFGFNRFYTNTVLTDVATNEEFNRTTNHSDWALSYGGALGFMINLKQNLLFLDLKCAYRSGNIVEYYTRIEGANFLVPIDNFELKTSPTSLLMPQIGITFLLNSPEKYEELEEE